MNWGLGGQYTARVGIKQSLSNLYQVWCPHVAQGPRLGAKQTQATSLAAPSYAPGGGLPTGRALLPDDSGISVSNCSPCAPHGHPSSTSSETPVHVAEQCDASHDDSAVVPRHAVTWVLDHSNPETLASTTGEAFPQPSSLDVLSSQHAAPGHVPIVSSKTAFVYTRPPADRTAEASSSSCDGGSIRASASRSCSRSVGRSSVACKNADGCNNRHPRRQAYYNRRSRRTPGQLSTVDDIVGGLRSTSAVDGASSCTTGGQESAGLHVMTGADPPPISEIKWISAPGPHVAANPAHKNAVAPACTADVAARQPLTLERLRALTPQLAVLELSTLQQRLETLGVLLQLDDTSSLMLCRVVPGLLILEPGTLRRAWGRLCVAFGGEEPTRGACVAAPLLLVLPPDRVPTCIASLATATAMPRTQAALLVADWPQLATHAPASLVSKLEGLQRLLGLGAADEGPSAQGVRARTVLRAALRAAPRLLTFSTAALVRHHTELSALLGPDRLAAALRREPGLLLQRPATVAAKLSLLQQLMDCAEHPGAVASLVVRQPGVLRRSLAALSRGCRALSIWKLRRRDKLRMCLSRPGLLTLPPTEVHGRCRWLRRLMLSNAYYHAALRRLPPSLVAVVVATLPQAWARLQYLAESSQECRMHVMDAVECRQEDFAARFPEFTRWLQFKIKLMGADNPWRGALRIRGFNTTRDKPAHGSPNQINLRQRHQQRQRSSRPSQQRQLQQQSAAEPLVPVVLAEACEVRSGGSTVARPRRVLRQPLAAAPVPLESSSDSSLEASSSSELSSVGAPSSALQQNGGALSNTSPALVILPPVGVEVGAVRLSSATPRRRLSGTKSDTAAAAVAKAGVTVSAEAAGAAAVELQRYRRPCRQGLGAGRGRFPARNGVATAWPAPGGGKIGLVSCSSSREWQRRLPRRGPSILRVVQVFCGGTSRYHWPPDC
ncbi:hypothetical protein Vretimale_15514 [Volvox reticuliferus]|uniref:Uncharacterized protein n=1 Tax=Volvox reticuliferus TaxID=1737510 RepID=A0A8J4FWD9_9CHLO|nr:hypothetical protein Vretifemale_15159 [Volvox reticuliferus]GIM12080.1 hypothetical protein Vretimale_15514 [Volvox reticuliferus]